MEESLKEKIARLKRECRLAEQAESFRDLLAEKRDAVEERIEELKNHMEQETFKLYRNKTKSDKDLSSFNEKMEANTRILNSVKETKQELDAKLDEYDLFSKELSLALRNDLIHAILEMNPSKGGEYGRLSQDLQDKLELQSAITSLQHILSRVHDRINEIARERKSVKKMNVLRYLFGKNPNVSITNSLLGIEKSVDEALSLREPLLAQTGGYPTQNKWLLDCFDRSRGLKELAGHRWGWKKLDREVIPYKETIENFEGKLKEFHLLLEADIKALRQEIVNWIERNSEGPL